MKILAISDVEQSLIYSPIVAERHSDAALVVSCGDLPYYYLEYVISTLDVPLYYVHGNHQNTVEHGMERDQHYPWGGIPLHGRVRCSPQGVLLAGINGTLRYNFGPYQYTQAEMWTMVLGLAPRLLVNRLRYGRALDIFVTHAPPWGIHDEDDLPHRGIKAFRWLDRVFQPAYHLHGHIHIYRQDTITETMLGATRVVNTYGHKVIRLSLPNRADADRVEEGGKHGKR